MKLANGYKLVYTAVAKDGKRVIKASKELIPTEDDIEVSLTDEEEKAQLFYADYENNALMASMDDAIPGGDDDVKLAHSDELFVEAE